MARKSKKLYSYTAVENYINNKLIPAGYAVEIVEGCLIDNYYCFAPDEFHYNFVFREVAVNEWSSALRMERSMKISQENIEFYEKAQEEQEAIGA